MLIDTHCHLADPAFAPDRPEVLDRAWAAGVARVVVIGESRANAEAALTMSAADPRILATAGVHPHDARAWSSDAEAWLRERLTDPRIVAVGETGLDFHYDNSPRDTQVAVFQRQLRAAVECNVPVIVHTREAEQETIDILRTTCAESHLTGVLHCFSGSLSLASQALELGFLVSFSGIITFKKADELRAVAGQIPLDRLLIETDCPYLAPIPFRGKRNEPAYVVEVARCLAEIRGLEVEELGRITAANFARLFKLDLQHSTKR